MMFIIFTRIFDIQCIILNINADIDKDDKLVYCAKFTSVCNACNITFYSEFTNTLLMHLIRMFRLNRKTQSFIVKSSSESLRVQRPM